MTTFQEMVRVSRAEGRNAALEMISRIGFIGSRAYFLDHSNTETPSAYGFWSGFLAVLADRIPTQRRSQ